MTHHKYKPNILINMKINRRPVSHVLTTACAALTCGIASILTTSCSSDSTTSDKTPVINLAANHDTETSAPLKVADFNYTQLSSDSTAAFFSKAKILDVVGDTVVLFEDNFQTSRLVMFNLNDGKYLGEINHMGQGPGEYRRIFSAFIDRKNQSVIVPDFDRPVVNRYSLTDGSLISTTEREPIMMQIEPTGSAETCINVAVPGPEGLNIRQYDGNFAPTDSIDLPGFSGGNFSILWANAGEQGIFMVADTLYAVAPSTLQPIAVLSRGEYTITPETDQEIMMRIMSSGESELEILKPYMLVRDIQMTGGKLLATTMHNGVKNSDIYDLSDGRLIYRNRYEELQKPSSLTVQSPDNRTIITDQLFGKDGVWYGIVSEENTDASSDATPGSTNCAIVSFKL